jgi:hypothetical protein
VASISPASVIIIDVTGLLQEALRRLEALPQDRQDDIASEIIEALEDDRESDTPLRTMALQALEEHRRGETRPLDELVG